MVAVRPEDLDFRDFDGFCSFLRDKLNWPVKEDLSKESLTYEFLSEELRIEEKQVRRLEDDSIYQLVPFTKGQPWGIFILELNNPKVYTTFLRQILRGLVPARRKSSTMPTWNVDNLLFICTCNYEHFAFAHFKGKRYQKAKLSTFGWTKGETRLRTLCEFNLPPLFYNEEFEYSPQEWLTEWSKAFDKEKLTEEFFKAYKFALEFIKKLLLAQNKASSQEVHSFAQQLLSRIMFLYFIEKKGWLKWKDYVQDRQYIGNLWTKYKEFKNEKHTFYSLWLSSLFFQAFNKKHGYLNLSLPSEIKESFNLMPYLNGGLFTENELDKIGFEIPDEVFELLFEIDPYDKRKGFLERYNFTIREDTPLEVEVAVDPEMLGKVYESLISGEERGKAGIFYTPRTEIDYMCRLSLVEHLFEETNIPKDRLIPLIFEPQTILGYENEENLRQIKRVLDKVRVVDPAVGSASFLVGMMNVLVDIRKNLSLKIDKREENLFALKNDIISKNLYGVDVKNWAVMVGELRLWLSLVIDTDEKELLKMGQNIYQQPLLPNLTFKIRQGDSLVEDIAGVPLSLRGKFKHIPELIKRKLTEIVDKKVEYFRSARLDKKREIEDLENELFSDIVTNEIRRIEGEIRKLEAQITIPAKQLELIKMGPEQEELFKKQAKRLKLKIENLRVEEDKFQKVLDNVGKRKTKDYFLWEIDFAEMFNEKGGFDIVVGNPPYIRQEKIAFPLETEEDYKDSEEWRAGKRLYKEKLTNSVRMNWGDFIKIDKKSDLYSYFYYAGLSLLCPGGIFCFINSNSWLDVGYGVPLQEFLLKNMEPIYIVDNQARRSFKESDINTVIVAIKRPKEVKDTTVKFINYKKPFEEVLTPDNLIEIEQSSKIKSTDDFRVFPITRKELLKDGVELPENESLLEEPEHLPYIGSKWGGKYLRAPDIFFKILEKGKDKLVRLGDIADVRRGLVTGLDKYLILNEPEIKRFALDKKYFKKILTYPRETTTIKFSSNDINRWCLNIDKNDIRKPELKRFIDFCLEGGAKNLSTVKSKKYWYVIDQQIKRPFLIIFRVPYLTFGAYLVNDDILVNDALIICGENVIDYLIFFNSIVCFLELLILSRAYTKTLGVMKIERVDLEKIDVIKINYKKLKIFHRPIINIFEELGFPKPNRDYSNIDPDSLSLDKILPDRRELDKIIFEALRLTEEEQLEVYRAVVELVKNRLVKAKSV